MKVNLWSFQWYEGFILGNFWFTLRFKWNSKRDNWPKISNFCSESCHPKDIKYRAHPSPTHYHSPITPNKKKPTNPTPQKIQTQTFLPPTVKLTKMKFPPHPTNHQIQFHLDSENELLLFIDSLAAFILVNIVDRGRTKNHFLDTIRRNSFCFN